MQDFFKTMDLYKAIVLLSLILLPLGGWWVSTIDEEIRLCADAIDKAERSQLEEIGRLQREIEMVAQTKGSSGVADPVTWFEGQIMTAGPGLSTSDFKLEQPKTESPRVGAGQVTDHVVRVDWSSGPPVAMDFIYAVLFNCESGASENSALKGHPSVWRLRELRLANATDAKLRAGKVPPPELQDRWEIKTMSFARREPKEKTRR